MAQKRAGIWIMASLERGPGFPKLVSPNTKAGKTLFGPINPTNPSVRMAYKGQSSFGITALLYTYQAYKTLFRPIKSISPNGI